MSWVGVLPTGWKVLPVKHLARVLNGATPKSGVEEFWHGDINWFTPTDLNNNQVTFLAESARKITRPGLDSCAAQLAPPDSIVISSRAPVGSVGITTLVSATNQGCRTLVPINGFPSKLLANALLAARDQLQLASNGTTFLELSTRSLADFKLPVPPVDQRPGLLAYIDSETTRIDTLVAKKTRFIELLREKRQALITQAVTKGLDPSVPMKDSGVEWLGEVPADWKVLSLKRIGRLKGGSGFPPSLQGRAENEIPFFKVGDLGKSPDGKYLGDTEHTITHGEAKELGATVFPANVLVWAKIGAALSLNRRRITTKPSCLDNNMTGFVPDTTLVSTRYSFYLMSSVDFTVHAKPGAVPSFSEGDQGELQISLPPRRFQDAIVAHLDRATSRIDRLIDKTERSIELLREHRTALITAAVTGKVDLREAA